MQAARCRFRGNPVYRAENGKFCYNGRQEAKDSNTKRRIGNPVQTGYERRTTMKVKSIRTTSSDNGKNLVIWYYDDDDVLQMAVTSIDNDVSDAINDFASTGDAEALLEYVLGMVHDIDGLREQVKDGLETRLEALSEHLSTDGDHVYYDNDTFENVMLDESLENHIVNILKGGDDDDLHAVCRFAERVYGNVDPEIRSQLFSWLTQQGMLTFDDDGRIIGYRGGQVGDDGVAESIHCGPAIVNGERVNGHVPNPDGAIVEMPRSSVQHDPSVGCSSGLHVGTYDYARSWANGVIMRVAVAPEDVVSVPFDCDAQKLRCCRFEVLDHEACDMRDSGESDTWQHNLTYHRDDYDDDYYDDDDDDECWEDDEDDDWTGMAHDDGGLGYGRGYGRVAPIIDTGSDDDNNGIDDDSHDQMARHYSSADFNVGSNVKVSYVPFGHDGIVTIDGNVMQTMGDSVVIETRKPIRFLRVYYDTIRSIVQYA